MHRAVLLGHWRRLSSRTYLASPTTASREQLLWAAVLHAGPAAALSGQFALCRHGWSADPSGRVDVLAPSRVFVPETPDFARIRRTGKFPRVRLLDGLPCVAADQATIHAAAWSVSHRQAMFIVVSMLQQRLTSASKLREVLRERPRVHRRRMILQIIDEYCDGATSMSEVRFRRLCVRFGVQKPIMQRRRKDAEGNWRYIDVDFRTASGRILTLEIDGLQHLNPLYWLDDITRQNSLAVSAPAVRLRVATWTLAHEPESFMPQLAHYLSIL